jgi:hypothetical protein
MDSPTRDEVMEAVKANKTLVAWFIPAVLIDCEANLIISYDPMGEDGKVYATLPEFTKLINEAPEIVRSYANFKGMACLIVEGVSGLSAIDQRSNPDPTDDVLVARNAARVMELKPLSEGSQLKM